MLLWKMEMDYYVFEELLYIDACSLSLSVYTTYCIYITINMFLNCSCFLNCCRIPHVLQMDKTRVWFIMMFASCTCRFVPGPKWWTGVTGWTFGKGSRATVGENHEMRSEGKPTWKTHGPPSPQDRKPIWHFPVKSIVDAADVFLPEWCFFHAGTDRHQTSLFCKACSQKEWNIMKNISTSCYSVLFFIQYS